MLLLLLLLCSFGCLTLCDPIDGSPPGSSVPGILQARTLECVAISFSNACMHAKSPQSCPTLCDPMECSLPGSSVPGDSPGKNTRVGCHFLIYLSTHMHVWHESEGVSHSVVSDSATPRTVACQAPLFMGFSRQEYWSGLHFLLQRIFSTQGSNLGLQETHIFKTYMVINKLSDISKNWY